jgi:hypothetical protein
MAAELVDFKMNSDDKTKALDAAIGQIEKAFGKGSVMKLGQSDSVVDIQSISTGSLGLDIALGMSKSTVQNHPVKQRWHCMRLQKHKQRAVIAPLLTPSMLLTRVMPANLALILMNYLSLSLTLANRHSKLLTRLCGLVQLMCWSLIRSLHWYHGLN